MSEEQGRSDPQEAIKRIIASAHALGVEMDEEEAIQWLTSIVAMDQPDGAPQVDQERGVFGHRVVLLDFDPADLERVRRVAAIVELEDKPNVETAIALSGSSAQSQVQTFPGDFDYFSAHWLFFRLPCLSFCSRAGLKPAPRCSPVLTGFSSSGACSPPGRR